jgi:hypothetical protein
VIFERISSLSLFWACCFVMPCCVADRALSGRLLLLGPGFTVLGELCKLSPDAANPWRVAVTLICGTITEPSSLRRPLIEVVICPKQCQGMQKDS